MALARKLRTRRRHGGQRVSRGGVLLLAALGIALGVVAPRKKLRDILENARCRSRWWLVLDIATALLGVATLDWLVDAF
jgi:hypothetical protein